MCKIFNKKNILTVPNLLSVIRILLIPIIVWLYVSKKDYFAAISIIILSGLTDIIDGIIARKFNMVSDLGKIIDPVADKLTQAALIICLAFKYRLMWCLIILFAVRETVMSVMGIIVIKKKDTVCSAKWYGKLNTVVLYTVTVMLILFPSISVKAANILIFIAGIVMIITLLLYALFYKSVLLSNKKNITMTNGEIAV